MHEILIVESLRNGYQTGAKHKRSPACPTPSGVLITGNYYLSLCNATQRHAIIKKYEQRTADHVTGF